MRVHTDHYFFIGSEHVVTGKPCQDHALSFSQLDTACIIISDGCSSGKETDMGARVVTFSTLSAAREVTTSSSCGYLYEDEVATRSRILRKEITKTLNLAKEDMLATRVYGLYVQGSIYVKVEGDGVIAWKNKDGSVYMLRYDWAENTPCYPSYDEDNFQLFKEVQGAHQDKGLIEIFSRWTPESGFVDIHTHTISIDDGVNGVTKRFTEDEVNNFSFLAVMSDGVTSVTDVDWKHIVLEILSFKNITGEFLKRRVMRMHKDWMKKSIKPLDDIAVACMAFVNEEGESHDHA